jgi:hypothetical protein
MNVTVKAASASREFTCEWKYTPPDAEEYADVQRGSVKVQAADLQWAIVEAKKAVHREHGIPVERVDVHTIGEDFL